MKGARTDGFAPIASQYDALMEHVDYGRWQHIVEVIGEMLPRPLYHIDVGCGTGTLMQRLETSDWHCVGMDLSPTMLRAAKNNPACARLVQADMCRPPFIASAHLVTCLFDSLNFLLEEEQVVQALAGMGDALKPGGVLYFDVVTMRMVMDHFEDEHWTENHDKFQSTWDSRYDKASNICETRVRVNKGPESITRERIYRPEWLRGLIEKAGLSLLAMRDANTWKEPGRRTTRIDYIVVKGDGRQYRKEFKKADAAIKRYTR